mmetsp:Transcript_29214/g.44169  ORF Transcript_29214/g.44169 Transcript_29214/m.44169 type:complete len:190 (+) Transcript_29214:63-632(+)
MSVYTYPSHIMYKMTGQLWFPRSKEDTESSLDALEREEEELDAKMKGIAEIQASVPIGVTPAIMNRHDKKIQELKEMTDVGPTVTTLFWNLKRKDPNDSNDDSQSVGRNSLRNDDIMSTPGSALMTPLSARRQESEFSLCTTPRSARRSHDFSYSLESNDESIAMNSTDTQVRFQSPSSSAGSLNVSMR